ncbi:MAG TPA: universal stress protein [Halococcus sp.]|nr:universal stress protein [Halococcus sp.]
MIDTVVIATDGSQSAARAVAFALDLARRFEAAVHALYVTEDDTDAEEGETALERALTENEDAIESVRETSQVTTAVREGDPGDEICAYAHEHDADLVATGTRGRHGEYRFVLGSVAEAVVRNCSVPVLTVRQLESIET